MKKIKSLIFPLLFSFVLSMNLYAFDDVKFLKDPNEALNSRVEVLLGRKLTATEIKAANPYIAIDKAKTPRLKTIVLTSLLISHDFVGTLLFRLLQHHAEEGAKVYVMTSKRFIFEKEKKWVEEFKKSSKNIYFVEYRNENTHAFWRKIQTTNHVKIFLTINENSNNCRLINGGRNTSDMYFFTTKPDHSSRPEMVQWGQKNYEWGYFDDLDVETNDCQEVEKVAALSVKYFKNYLTPKSHTDESVILNINGDSTLEKKYIAYINSAEDQIKILSPYINFTKKIFQALLEAKKRGVEVEIVSAKSLSNDYLPIFLQVQQDYNLRKVVKYFNVYLYENKDFIPHAKVLLIDDKILSVGSVNMNRRSFIYDNEFTQIFSDRDVIQDFNHVYQSAYKSHSFKVDENYKFKRNALILPLKIFNNSF